MTHTNESASSQQQLNDTLAQLTADELTQVLALMLSIDS